MNKKFFCLILSVALLGFLTPAIANAETNNENGTVTEEIESFDESTLNSNAAIGGERPI